MITTMAPKPEPDRPLTCFVIGPIGSSHAPHGTPEREAYEHHLRVFEQVIVPACEKFDIAAVRAEGIRQAGDIHEQICRYVIQSDLVIADVSGGNPNVMYELGVRHVTGKPTIHIGEWGQLPFDIASVRTIMYRRQRSSLAEALNNLQDALEVGLREGFHPLTPARVLRGLQTPDGAWEDSSGSGIGQTEDPPGLLDEFATLEDGVGEMTADMEKVSGAVNEIKGLTDEANAEMAHLTQSHAPAAARLAAVARYADAIGAPSEELHMSARSLAERMGALDSGVRAALGLIEVTPPEERDEGALEFLGQLLSLSDSVRGTMPGFEGFGTAAGGLVRVSRHLRRPAKNITSAVERMKSVLTCIDDWASQARVLLPQFSIDPVEPPDEGAAADRPGVPD